MADRISDQQLTKVIDWLKQRTDAICPFCGGHTWTVDNELGSLPSYHEGEAAMSIDRGHTLVLVTCDQCGFSAPFSSKKLAVS